MDDRSSSTDDPRLTAVVSWWKREAPRWGTWPLLALALVAAFSAGRFSGPERVEVRTEYLETVHKTKVKAKAKTTQRFTKVVVLPDGTRTEETATTTTAKSDLRIEEKREVADVRSSITTAQPDWRVGVLIGASWKEPALRLAGPLVLGATVERRIIGGCYLGAWGGTWGAAGVMGTCGF